MAELYCVRADFGTYTKNFVEGGYVAIGWLPKYDLSKVRTKEDLYPIYKKGYPEDKSNLVIGQQVGQISRFFFDIQPGDFVLTPAADTEWLHYGRVENSPYFYAPGDSGCPFPHRRKVAWANQRVKRGDFSVPFQNTIRSSLTVFYVSQKEEFLEKIGEIKASSRVIQETYDSYKVVLEQILQLNDVEFEFLITHLLTALGFEGSKRTGKSGDGGVDATGELNVSNLAKVRVYVQAKRYKLGSKISAGVVKQLRQAIPFGGQGAFITTADFQNAAGEVALESGFPRIGLINGRQLVDLLIEHWEDIPVEFRTRLGLRPGLVRS